jgi:hypothetical protein
MRKHDENARVVGRLDGSVNEVARVEQHQHSRECCKHDAVCTTYDAAMQSSNVHARFSGGYMQHNTGRSIMYLTDARREFHGHVAAFQ